MINVIASILDILRLRSVPATDNDVITLVRLQRNTFNWFKLLLFQLFYFRGEDNLRWQRRVNTRSLDTDQKVPSVLNKLSRIQPKNTRLIRLRHIREYHVHHRHQHAVLLWVTRVFDYGDHVRALFGHVHEVATGSLRELNGVNASFGTNEIGNVRDCGSRSTSEVEYLTSGLDVNVTNTSNNC